MKHCLAALDVTKLMEWWPGRPHFPHRNPQKVRSIQRSLDWKRVAQIAAYLLQSEIVDAPERLDRCFRKIYEPKADEPGREWPPRIPKVIGFERSEYPTFANVLVHVNGADIHPLKIKGAGQDGAAQLVFDERAPNLNFSVIDGQHRVNGAFFAVSILKESNPDAVWEIPSEIFIDLDKPDESKRQAQIFIDVNFYQKRVDRSLVADLFPTARGTRGPLDNKERAQDLGRKLMLEVGPLVGMIQIPGIKFGVKDVVALATLNGAIEDQLPAMQAAGIDSLESQAQFLATCLDAWLVASGRKHDVESPDLDANNVAYQGRVLVGFLNLLPACIWRLRKAKILLSAPEAKSHLTTWLKSVMRRAELLEEELFIPKSAFKEKGYLGSGGVARFRNSLWAAVSGSHDLSKLDADQIAFLADKHRSEVMAKIGGEA